MRYTRLGLPLLPQLMMIVLPVWSLALPSSAAGQWWKERPVSRLDQKIVDPSGRTAARLKWDDGYIEVKAGATADKAIALNRAHERGLALDTARQLAYLKLAEVVEGVTIDGVTVVKNAMIVDQTVRSTVRARIRGAVLVGEEVRDLADGSVWAEVILGLRLHGRGGVTESLAPWLTSRPTDAFAADPRFRVTEAYSGLIVDASDSDFSLALAPRVVEEGSGKVVFGPQTIPLAAITAQGAVGYAPSLSEARRTARVGSNPLIVRAIGTSGGRKGDLVLSLRDAQRVLAADRDHRFLEKAAVVVVLGRERRELASRPGRRHALVIGIDDYPPDRDGLPRLGHAAHDARTLAGALRRAGGFSPETVTLLENQGATRERMLQSLRDLRGRVADEDTVLFFFSGHGSVGPSVDGRLHYFLLPHDGRLGELPGTALMDDQLEEVIGQLPARQVIVLLDTCFSGGGGGVVRARGVTNSAMKAPATPRSLVEASAGRVVMSASRPDQPAFEDDQRGGLFTSFLVEGLDGAADLNGDGVVTVLELYQYVAPRVRDYARRQYQLEQTPVLEVRALFGEIVLARRP